MGTKYKRVLSAIILTIIVLGSITMFVGCNLFDSLSGNDEDGPKDVTITLDPNGGTISMLTIKGKSSESMELPTPERDGYEFAGWFNGYSTVSQTEFPNEDMTLTARYYAKTNAPKSTVYQMTLNKEYSDTTLYFERKHFDNPAAIDYLVENHNVPVTIKVTVEAYISTAKAGQWIGANGDLTLMGANKSDVLKNVNINNYSYSTYNMTVNTESSYMYASDSTRVLHFEGYTSYGSTDLVYRNLTIEVCYTEIAGSLV